MLNAIPTLQSQVESLQRELYLANQQLQKAEEALRQERQKNAGIESGVRELRKVLNPLYQALLHIYGEIEGIGVEETAVAPAFKNNAVWENWKQKLGGLTAKAIDALLLHGAMNQTQLRIVLSCASRSVTNVVSALNKAGLINKSGGKISLKEL
jgi:hypothetical protein